MSRRCPAPLIALAAALAFGLGSRPLSSRADVLTSNSNTSNTTTELLQYTLTANQAIPGLTGTPPAPGTTNPPTPELVATIAPVSVVTPPAGSNSQPLQIMPIPDANGYYYINPNQLAVYVGNNPLDGTAITQQALGLSFYGPGLAKGQSVTFTLPFASSIVGAGNPPPVVPQFTAIDPTSLQAYSSSALPYTIKYDGIVPVGGGSGSVSGSGSGSGSSSSTVSEQGNPTSQGHGHGHETPEPLSLVIWAALAGIGIRHQRARARARRVGPRP